MPIAAMIIGGIVFIVTLPIVLSHYSGMSKIKKDLAIEKLKYQKEMLQLEIEKEKTQVRLLEEENKKLDKIIYEK